MILVREHLLNDHNIKCKILNMIFIQNANLLLNPLLFSCTLYNQPYTVKQSTLYEPLKKQSFQKTFGIEVLLLPLLISWQNLQSEIYFRCSTSTYKTFNPFNTKYLQWTLPFIVLDQTKVVCRGKKG